MRAFIIVFLVAIVHVATAQYKNNDAELWTGVSLEKNLAKNLEISFEEQLRLDRNYSSTKVWLHEVGMAYRLNKHLRFRGQYRYSPRREQQGYTYRNVHRYSLDISLRYKKKPFIFNVRNRFQSTYSWYDARAENVAPLLGYTYRLKPYVAFDLDKFFQRYIGMEVYYPLNPTDPQPVSNLRMFVGADIELNKYSELTVFYMFQQEQYEANPETDYILGLKYAINLDKFPLFGKKKTKASVD